MIGILMIFYVWIVGFLLFWFVQLAFFPFSVTEMEAMGDRDTTNFCSVDRHEDVSDKKDISDLMVGVSVKGDAVAKGKMVKQDCDVDVKEEVEMLLVKAQAEETQEELKVLLPKGGLDDVSYLSTMEGDIVEEISLRKYMWMDADNL